MPSLRETQQRSAMHHPDGVADDSDRIHSPWRRIPARNSAIGPPIIERIVLIDPAIIKSYSEVA